MREAELNSKLEASLMCIDERDDKITRMSVREAELVRKLAEQQAQEQKMRQVLILCHSKLAGLSSEPAIPAIEDALNTVGESIELTRQLSEAGAHCQESLAQAEMREAELVRKLAEQQAIMRLAVNAFDKTAAEICRGRLKGGTVEVSDLRVEAWTASANCDDSELTRLLSEAEQRGREDAVRGIGGLVPRTVVMSVNGDVTWQDAKWGNGILVITVKNDCKPMPWEPEATEKSAPEGWRLVPIEPTNKMAAAFLDAPDTAEQVWNAMLSAAPTSSKEEV